MHPILRAWTGLAFGLTAALAAAAPVAPGDVLRFRQQDHRTDSGVVAASAIGRVEIDVLRLRQRSGLPSGYLNVATAQGWVVRNVPVPPVEAYPYSKLSTRFALGVSAGTRLGTLQASVDYSAAPLPGYSGTGQTHAVTPLVVAQGGGEGATVDPPEAPDLSAISFGNLQGGDDVVVQFDHPNIEAAMNQCVPMSVANSLQFLKDTAGLPVPHAHKPGLRESVAPGDDSLVGKIETQMNRSVTNRSTGSYTAFVGGLQGKLKYLAGNGLASRVQVTHWGDLAPNDVSASLGGTTMKSTGKGATVDFDAVMEAMRDGQNCEMDYTWDGGGHAVDLVAIGKTRGQHWVMHSSDVEQSSDSEGAGPAGSQFEYLGKPDASGRVFMSGTGQRVRLVICEKALPPPATVTVVERIDPAGHACCTEPPPQQLTVLRRAGSLSFTGSTGWLPLTGTVDASGSFTASSTTTVAGFPNVRSTFTGTYAEGVYDGTLTIGARGELPQSRPISYRLRVAEADAEPAPAMRANGYRRGVTVGSGDAVRLSVGMRAGRLAGTTVDWWLVAAVGDQLFHYDLAAGWRPGLAPTLTGALVDLPDFAVPTFDGLPAGTYTLYFGVDRRPNGVFDADLAHVEQTTLTVRP